MWERFLYFLVLERIKSDFVVSFDFSERKLNYEHKKKKEIMRITCSGTTRIVT